MTAWFFQNVLPWLAVVLAAAILGLGFGLTEGTSSGLTNDEKMQGST